MNSPRPKYEGWLYWLAFLIALGLRLIQLGASPLTDFEARFALQALHIAQGKQTLLAPQAAYILFTSVLFFVVETTNFMARFVPALAGSMLVFAPRLFREKLKPRPALILAFLFAFDPGLVALSRQASGTILAVTFLLFAWGMWRNGRTIPAGIFAGLALLSGPSIWSGILILALASIFLRGIGNGNKKITSSELRTAMITSVITLLLGGTLFFTVPNGLSAWLSSLPSYLTGWTTPSVFTPGLTLLTFFLYEPLGIFLASFAVIRGFRVRSQRAIQLNIWLGVSFIIAVFYRQPTDLVWVIIPLLVLASQEFSRSFVVHPEERVEIAVVSGAAMLLLIFIWFRVANIGLNPYQQVSSTPIPFFGRMLEIPTSPNYIILFGALLILVVCIVFVAFGWSARTARLGATWSLTVFLGVYAVASAWGASGVRTPNGVELWTADQTPIHVDLLVSSADQLSLLSRGHIDAQPVTILGIDSPALEWVLRNHEVKTVDVLDPTDAPPIVITPPMNELGLPSAYRGQDFSWRHAPSWDQLKAPDWIRWLVYRQLPGTTETILLWGRDDLFPDARENPQP